MGINMSAIGNTLGHLGYRTAQVGIYAPVVYLGTKAIGTWHNTHDKDTVLAVFTENSAKFFGAIAWVAMHALAGIVGSFALATRGSASITAARLSKAAPFFGLASIAMTVYWAMKCEPSSKSGGGRDAS